MCHWFFSDGQRLACCARSGEQNKLEKLNVAYTCFGCSRDSFVTQHEKRESACASIHLYRNLQKTRMFTNNWENTRMPFEVGSHCTFVALRCKEEA